MPNSLFRKIFSFRGPTSSFREVNQSVIIIIIKFARSSSKSAHDFVLEERKYLKLTFMGQTGRYGLST